MKASHPLCAIRDRDSLAAAVIAASKLVRCRRQLRDLLSIPEFATGDFLHELIETTKQQLTLSHPNIAASSGAAHELDYYATEVTP